MENFTKEKSLICCVEADGVKFYENGNAAAGTRLGKGMQDLKNLAQGIGAEVTEKKNSK